MMHSNDRSDRSGDRGRSEDLPPARRPGALARPTDRDRWEDRALEAWLAEVFGGPQPPDLSETILERLESESSPGRATRGRDESPQADVVAGQTRPAASLGSEPLADMRRWPAMPLELDKLLDISSSPVRPRQRRLATRRQGRRVAIGLAGIAAAWVAILVAYPGRDATRTVAVLPDGVDPSETDLAGRPGDGSEGQRLGHGKGIGNGNDSSHNASPDKDSDASESSARSGPRGIPLAVFSGDDEDAGPAHDPTAGPLPATAGRTASVSPSAPARTRLAPVRLVSQRLDEDWGHYWAAVGVTPSAERSPDELAAWLEERFGVSIPSSDVIDAERLQAALADDAVARQLATRWIAAMTGSGFRQMGTDRRQEFLDELTRCVQGTHRFDDTLIGWLALNPRLAGAWHAAIAADGRHAMVSRLAALTMDVDLRCARCHDSGFADQVTQADYWSFAALLRRDARRQGGRWTVEDRSGEGEDQFYDLPDGRRRLIEPGIPPSWADSPGSLATPVGSTPTSVQAWAIGLRDSPRLARGVVHSIWKWVHGRPLRPTSADLLATPRDEKLTDLETLLADDLLASGFNINRTLALVIRSPASLRTVPQSLERSGMLAADGETRRAVAAFAVGAPAGPDLSLADRLEIALRSVGGRLDSLSDDERLLAQISPPAKGARRDGGGGSGRAAAEPAEADLPTRDQPFPLSWLDSLESFDERIDHLAYLAGHGELPDAIRESVRRMRQAELSDELILHRVWWLLGARR